MLILSYGGNPLALRVPSAFLNISKQDVRETNSALLPHIKQNLLHLLFCYRAIVFPVFEKLQFIIKT